MQCSFVVITTSSGITPNESEKASNIIQMLRTLFLVPLISVALVCVLHVIIIDTALIITF